MMMMEEEMRTPDQSSSDWAAEIEAFLDSFRRSRTPSPAVSEGGREIEIEGIAVLNYEDSDVEDSDDEAGYYGDDEAD